MQSAECRELQPSRVCWPHFSALILIRMRLGALYNASASDSKSVVLIRMHPGALKSLILSARDFAVLFFCFVVVVVVHGNLLLNSIR